MSAKDIAALNTLLATQTYLDGFLPSAKDFSTHDSFDACPDPSRFPHACRWFVHIQSFSQRERQNIEAPPPAATAAEPPRNTERRDKLITIQTDVQQQWDASKVFESNVPKDTTEPKYFGCFPYPYMNGKLHLGHTFTLSKVEFAVGYHKMQGKNAFFPFAFHCTGMPIQACANKIRNEIKQFGQPPVFPEDGADGGSGQQQKQTVTKADPTQFKSVKSKAAAKTGNETRQWKIMRSLGFDDSEIAPFQNPIHWLNYFPPVCQDDITLLGCKVDWRRSFITTEANPYYDAFVRWQFNTLKALDKVKFGKRYAVWSPTDKQPCADHDRASGEGHGPQEYTIVKMKVQTPTPEWLKGIDVGGRDVFLAAATLRPETMYGQTNCWLHPDGEYGVFAIDKKTAYVLTERAARNLAFQDRSEKWGEVKCLGKVTGNEMMGTPLASPNCKYDTIYTLPMATISMDKTTGVVTSVPSDSPDDYAALQDLRNKPANRERLGIRDEWVMPFEVVPIIDVEGEGNMIAVKLCEELGVLSQNDRVKLAEAHDAAYKKGFYLGRMAVGKYKGMKVEEAKPLIRDDLLGTKEADKYAEPAGEVVSRSGDVCTVALCDQWYLDYGEEKWLEQTRGALKETNCFHNEARKQFESTLSWLNQWACSRQFGLGTKLPWDPQWLIESLSDSTIYMAYYTIAHLLQGDMFGNTPGSLGITPEQLTQEVFDCVFLGKPYPKKCAIAKEKLTQMANEFNYWYPVDLRVSGKDLIQNHLTFFMYNHTAIFPKKHWPQGIRCNGHLLLDSKKMSKSTGNFMTLREALLEYSADACRMALADAGDGIDDANFVKKTADTAILRLTTLIELATYSMEKLNKGTLRSCNDKDMPFLDRWFENMIHKSVHETEENYEKGLYREALRTGFFELSKSYGVYVDNLVDAAPNARLVKLYLEIQTLMLAPITPHTCEHIWKLIGQKESIVAAKWPKVPGPDLLLMEQGESLFSIARDIRLAIQKHMNPKKGPKRTVKKATLYVAKEFPPLHRKMLSILQSLYNKETDTPPDKGQVTKAFAADDELKPKMKKLMGVAVFTLEQCKNKGIRALDTTVGFDELSLLRSNAASLAHTILPNTGLELVINDASDDCPESHAVSKSLALPLKPSVMFE